MAKTPIRKIQIKYFPFTLYKNLKKLATDEDRPVKEIYDDAIVEFFKARKTALKAKKEEGRPLQYLVPDGEEIKLDVELDPERSKELERVAEEDNKSQSTVVYTSLIEFAEKKKLW